MICFIHRNTLTATILHALAIHTRKSVPLQTQGGMFKEKQNVKTLDLAAKGKDSLAHKTSKVTFR
jgi:hypothetical protein